ncbi:MAG TPA: three-Cys-motif partner protein TcmP [Terriglobales bacterium]|nr:three-Cys-motif partner protein TcmP [Terriglobales bacterium]
MKRRFQPHNDPRQANLIELPERPKGEKPIRRLLHPIWTKNKAKLIERYLFLFVQITKCGTYIDGFAGPQQPSRKDMWAAKLVLNIHLLQHFHLFELNGAKVKLLELLKREQPERDTRGRRLKREVKIYPGDFNREVLPLLKGESIPDTEPVFCLLDQRMFECHWSTVEALARYKSDKHNKFEIFYFFGIGWVKRSISGIKKNFTILKDWWGREDWEDLRNWTRDEILNEMVRRFRDDLGYKSVQPYPIFKRQNSGDVMYYMIHATDHADAPDLMARAYNTALQRKGKQLSMFPEPATQTRGTKPRTRAARTN